MHNVHTYAWLVLQLIMVIIALNTVLNLILRMEKKIEKMCFLVKVVNHSYIKPYENS